MVFTLLHYRDPATESQSYEQPLARKLFGKAAGVFQHNLCIDKGAGSGFGGEKQ